jgi:Bacteriophage tail sheath protein
MSLTPTYPGVYIQELPSASRTITGVATSITAFVGRAQRGPIDTDAPPQGGPRLIHSFGDFERIYGGLWKQSSMSYAVQQYYLNGGKDAVIVRVQNGAAPATFTLTGGAWKLEAANPGVWADQLSINVDLNVDPDQLSADPTIFNLTVVDDSVSPVYTEKYLNVSADQSKTRFIQRVLEEESQLVAVKGSVPQPGAQPPSGTFDLDSGSSSDGNTLTYSDIIGVENSKTGIYALQNVDLFNILCIPSYDENQDGTTGDLYTQVYPAALSYFQGYNKRAILLVDPPSDWVSDSAAVSGMGTLSYLRAKGQGENAAIYFPRIQLADPLEEGRPREFVPCGAVAGVIAQTDGQRGVWKAPAGLEAGLSGVLDLTDGDVQVRLTDQENGDLNPLGVNCLRIRPVVGPVVWGARTLRGADALADQWKYLSIRRTAQYIEESLYRGTQWVVFEPNDEPLWKAIRLNVGAFMQGLFAKGAFQGSTPSQAYLVKCDGETNPQYLIDQGIVTILVGFAPLYPAEFVILQIQQLTAQAGS